MIKTPLRESQNIGVRLIYHHMHHRDQERLAEVAATHCHISPPQVYAMLSWEVSSGPRVSSVGEESPVGTSTSTSAVVSSQEASLQSPPIGITEGSAGLEHWKYDCDGAVGETWHLDFGRPSSYLQHTNSPNQWLCSSARSRWWHVLARELGRVQVCFKQNALSALDPGLSSPKQEGWS